MLLLCDYFDSVKKSKKESYDLVLKHLKQVHCLLEKSLLSYKSIFKKYCFESILTDKFNDSKDDSEIKDL